MSPKSESIATKSTNLAKTQFKLNNELQELYSLKYPDRPIHNDRIEYIQLELLDSIDQDILVLEKRIENKVYELVENGLTTKDIVNVLLADGFIKIDGLTLVTNTELQNIANFLGFKGYMVQPYACWLSIYFHDDVGVFDLEE